MPIKSINKKLIITIGSSRYSHDFEASIPFKSKRKYKIYHVSDEDEHGKARYSKAILEQVLSASKEFDLRAVISFARSTVIGSVENVAKVLEDLKQRDAYIDCKFIGPSFLAAKTMSNKLLSAKSMKRNRYSLLKTVVISDSNIQKIYKELESEVFPLPSVLKATYLSGGAGMHLVRNPQDLFFAYKTHKKQKITESILTEFLIGPEASVEMLYLGSDIFVFPMSIKDPTNESLDHGDNKVKIAGYLYPLDGIRMEAVEIAQKYDAFGYFAIEGIIFDLTQRRWKIMEGTPRFTGSYPMFNATIPGFDSMAAIFNFIDNKTWTPSSTIKQQVVIQIPIFMNSKEMAEKVVMQLLQNSWIVFARVENLSELPFSTDERIRIQITFKAGTDGDLQSRVKYMQELSNNHTIKERIMASIKRLDDYFPDLIYRKNIFQQFITGK